MKKTKRENGPRNYYDVTLDLHGMFADEAMALVEKTVFHHPHSGILVIHGNGNGILRTRIRRALELRRFAYRDFFKGEDINAAGLDGVTIIYT